MKKKLIGLLIMLLTILIVFITNNIDEAKATPKTLVQTVIDLSKGETYTAGNGNGVYYTNSHEYRYVGGEVDNYVSFNNDLYRIIGVFDSNSTGVDGNLVKLIRARELTAAAWGAYNTSPEYTTFSSYKNNWDGLDSNGTTTNGTGVKASANVLLNEFYLNPNKASKYGECINWTYTGDATGKYIYNSKNCTNIKGYGIQTEILRNYIKPVTWYLYGYSATNLSKNNWYKCERNNYTGCTSANSDAYSGTTTASVGLMYVSDYLYASGYIASNATTTGSSTFFINLNWLYNGMEWTITPLGKNNSEALRVDNSGSINSLGTLKSLGIRPTFYLKSQVYVTGGNGSFSNPYTIACDDCNETS